MSKQVLNRPLGPVMLDVVGKTLTEDDLRRIQHPLTGGVILFARNYANREQVTQLCKAIHAARPGMLIAVDHEGGRVQRFRTDGFTHLPAMKKLGQRWDEDVLESCKLATAVGYVLATELRACGIDLSFTPVLDLDYGDSEVIGDRAFHRDPRVVTMLAKNLNHGLALAGMANCGKHFPGHGFVAADSHVAIPVDDRQYADILKEDAAPYGWLGMSLTAVMPAHVIYPSFDKHPAGFSKKWLTLLREALTAGCDMVLICNSPDKADQLLDGLDTRKIRDALRSAERLSALIPTSHADDWDTLQENETYIAAKKLAKSLT
ncbi:MAG: beta-N-acetylhexosaminidase [Oxalobacteraceae bacterium]|nr:beta-N-acetylhexosaminidase [Oxalobacteraceae bacterium]